MLLEHRGGPHLARLRVAVVSLLLALRPAAASAQEPAVPTVTLEEAIRLALQADPAAVAAEEAVRLAEAEVLQARGSWLPTITIGSAYSNSSNQRFDQTTGRLVSQSYSAQAQASYEIFAGGRRLAERRIAAAGSASADAALRAQRFETTLATTQAFYEAVAAEELERVARQRLERARQQLAFAEVRLEVGTATRSDQLRAELEVGDAELAVVDAESALRGARLALGRRIGVAREVRPTARALPERAPPLPPLPALIERAERSSPQAIAATTAVGRRSAEKWATYTSYLPSIRLAGGYDWFGFEFPPDQPSWSLRLFASYPIFNGFQREAAVDRAQAQERIARAQERDILIGVRVAVEEAVREIESAERRVAIAQRAVELAREDLRVQEERYQIGASTIIELQTSQVTLAEAEVAEIRARQALGVAVAGLESLLGAELGED